MTSVLEKPVTPQAWPMGPAAPPLREAWLSVRRLWARARQPDVMTPLALALAVRLVVLLVATAVAVWYFAPRNPTAYAGFTFQDFWERKDAYWYLSIAELGYTYPAIVSATPNFFPLFPMLVAFFGAILRLLHVPEPYLIAGMAISWVTFAAALVVFYQLALYKFHFNRRVALGAVLLLSVFPFSFYDGAVYTESIYLICIAVAFLAVERRNWLLATAAAGIASATRPPGLILGACVALAYTIVWLQDARRTGRWLRWDILTLALIPVGYLCYLVYSWITFGDPLQYQKVSAAGWHAGLQLTSLRFTWNLLSDPNTWAIVHHPKAWLNTGYLLVTTEVAFVALAALCLIAVPFAWRLLGAPYGLFLLLSIVAPLVDFPDLNSLGRYLSVLFPAFFLAAYLLRDHPRMLYALSGVSFVALCLYASYFIAGFGLS